MVMAGRSVHRTTLFFLGKLEQAVNQYIVHILSLVKDNNSSCLPVLNQYNADDHAQCDFKYALHAQ